MYLYKIKLATRYSLIFYMLCFFSECCTNIQVSGITGSYSYLNKTYGPYGIENTKQRYKYGSYKIYWEDSNCQVSTTYESK